MNFEELILDANSIINFIRYYHQYYAYKEKKIIFEGLQKFLIKKIEKGEIIILDKVYDELRSSDLQEFKSNIKNYVVDSLYLFNDVQTLRDRYYKYENEKFYNHDKTKIDADLEKYETTHADLFIIAYCNQAKLNGKNAIIISEESNRNDKKLVEKMPIMCKKDNENLWCRKLPFSLFEIYKQELQFSLNIA